MDPDEPQKPKPTTDGKQTAGHSNLTRSRVKGTSHPDNNSGPQAHLPLRKDQTSMTELLKQGIINDNSDLIDSNTVDEYTSSETALQNDLVLESLFSYMNWSDLLSCRVVNKQWQDEATKELRRRKLVIRFSFQFPGNQVSRDKGSQEICKRLSECRTPSLLSSFQVKADAINDLGSAGVGRIFTAIGIQLKNLTLNLNYLYNQSASKRSSLMTHLQNLLFRQAPNLEFLQIKFDSRDYWQNHPQALDSSDCLQNDHNKFQLLPNLKSFIVTGTPPPNFFEDVMNNAVNLKYVGGVWSTSSLIKSVLTPNEGLIRLRGSSLPCLKYFLSADGRDKLHLLKRFRVYLGVEFDVEYDEREIQLIETFMTEHKQNLKLETLECVELLFDGDSSIAPRIVGVINQILECSSGSLKKLRIEPRNWLDDFLIIPRLPQLQELCYDCELSSAMYPPDTDDEFFPPGFNMNYSFPNVSTVVLLRCSADMFWVFVHRTKIEITDPVPSIRQIILVEPDKEDSSVLPLVTDFRHVFPNLASISYTDDNEKYYEI